MSNKKFNTRNENSEHGYQSIIKVYILKIVYGTKYRYVPGWNVAVSLLFIVRLSGFLRFFKHE